MCCDWHIFTLILIDEMSITLTNIFLVVSFLLLASKWFVTGHYGRVNGQMVFVIPLFCFLYLSVLAILYKSSPGSRNLRKKGKTGGLPKFQINRNSCVQAALLSLYLLVFSVALFRSVGASTGFTWFLMTGRFLTAISMAILVFFVFYAYAHTGQFDRLWTVIIIGFSSYIIVNIIGAVVGVENTFVEIQDWTKDDTVLGVLKTRISFPFSANHHAFAIEAGLLCSMVIARMLQPRIQHRFVYILIFLLSIVAILAANTRTPLVAIAAVLALSTTWRTWGRKLICPLLIIVLIIPVFFTYIDTTPWLEDSSIDTSFLSRSKDLRELSTFNNRTMIWRHLFNEFRNIKLIHLVGFGAFGHVATGLCYKYGWMWQDSKLITCHNTYLQYLLDFGYIGLLLLLAMITNVFNVLKKTNKFNGRKPVPVLHPALSAMLYLTVCGLFEVNIYFNQILTFYVFLCINHQVIWQCAKRKSQFNTELAVGRCNSQTQHMSRFHSATNPIAL